MILSAALVLLGAHATSGYAVTDLGHYFVHAGTGISINSRDEVALTTILVNNEDKDEEIDTYVWSKGTTTHIEIPNAPSAKMWFTDIRDDGSLRGQVLDRDMSVVNGFTWTKSSGVTLTPALDGSQEAASLVVKDTFLVEEGIDSTHRLLKTVHHSDVLAQVEAGDFFQAHAINEAGAITGSAPDAGQDDHAIRVDPGQDVTWLAMPPNPLSRQVSSNGLAINDAGYVAGCAMLGFVSPTTPEGKMGAIWAPDGSLTTVSDPTGLVFLRINNHNQAIGWKGDSHPSCAVVYDSVNGLRDLNTLVPAGTPKLLSAAAINDNGSIVCVSSGDEVFLLKPNS